MSQINKLVAGEEFTGFYIMKQLEVKQTNTTPPKDYFDIILSDTTEEVPAKMWDISTEDKESIYPLDLVKVQGQAQLYKDKLQVKISRMRTVTLDDGVTITDFIRAAPTPAGDLVCYIQSAASSIQDEQIRSIVEYCLDEAKDKLLHYPAAKAMHHAYYSGLAYHLVRMLEIGDFICQQRPFFNPDLIKAGIILHDIAKTEEYEAELGMVKEYSLTGKLLGHLSLAALWITEAAIHLGIGSGNEKVLLLQHLVLSHHNLGEWGSPVQPQIPEAVALHYIDLMDAKLQMVEDALALMPANESWTQQVRGLEDKSIYRSDIHEG